MILEPQEESLNGSKPKERGGEEGREKSRDKLMEEDEINEELQ